MERVQRHLGQDAEDAAPRSHFALDPCVGAHDLGWYERFKARPCPRVELLAENAALAHAAFMVLGGDDTAPLTPGYLRAAYPCDEERAAAYERLYTALRSEAVIEWRRARTAKFAAQR